MPRFRKICPLLKKFGPVHPCRKHTKELYRRLEAAGNSFEWSDIKQDLKSLQEVTLDEDGKRLAIRNQCQGTCGKVFQTVGVAVPPTIRDIAR